MIVKMILLLSTIFCLALSYSIFLFTYIRDLLKQKVVILAEVSYT